MIDVLAFSAGLSSIKADEPPSASAPANSRRLSIDFVFIEICSRARDNGILAFRKGRASLYGVGANVLVEKIEFIEVQHTTR